MSSWTPPSDEVRELQNQGVSSRQIDRYAQAFSLFRPNSDNMITSESLKDTYSRIGKHPYCLVYL